jgi:hypothetical protein
MSESGSYRYLLNGEPAPFTEAWQRQYLSAGKERLSSSRRAPGIEIITEASLVDGRVKSCEIQWLADTVSIQAGYSLEVGGLQFQRQVDGVAVETETLEAGVDSPALLFPLMRIFTGPLICRLLQQGGEGTVIVPAIGQPDDTDALLRPQFSQRQARVLEAQTELLLDGQVIECRLCEYTGDQYAAGSRFWIGEDETLLRYQWQQGPEQNWDVCLEH